MFEKRFIYWNYFRVSELQGFRAVWFKSSRLQNSVGKGQRPVGKKRSMVSGLNGYRVSGLLGYRVTGLLNYRPAQLTYTKLKMSII
jgi:hypothetical protein